MQNPYLREQSVEDLTDLLRPAYKPFAAKLCWNALRDNPNPQVKKFLVAHSETVQHFQHLSRSFGPKPPHMVLTYSFDNWQTSATQCSIKSIPSNIMEFIQNSKNPHWFIGYTSLSLMHIWNTQPNHVLYRLPLELIRMIADFM